MHTYVSIHNQDGIYDSVHEVILNGWPTSRDYAVFYHDHAITHLFNPYTQPT